MPWCSLFSCMVRYFLFFSGSRLALGATYLLSNKHNGFVSQTWSGRAITLTDYHKLFLNLRKTEVINSYILCYCVQSVAMTAGWGPLISEVTPRSHNRNSEYCLLSEERDPVRDKQQTFVVFYKFLGPLTQVVHTTGSAGFLPTPVCQSLTIYKN